MEIIAILCFAFMTCIPLGGAVAEAVKGKATRARK